MIADPLPAQVRRLFAELTHAGISTAPDDRQVRTTRGEAGREQRGTRVRFVLRRRGATILEARYQTYGCPHTLAACEWLAREVGVAAVPGSSFFREPVRHLIRFHFAKREETLTAAGERLKLCRERWSAGH